MSPTTRTNLTPRHPRNNPQAAQLIATYMAMAELGYRPGAPSDGCGNITEDQPPTDLTMEALRWARRFQADDKEHTHWVGCTDYSTKGIVAMVIEVARLLNGGTPGRPYALRLLCHAVDELAAIVSDDEGGDHAS